ncbi:MAG: CPA2 family monovalent cation:H+ antiporter-2 [Alphaproteobacteria bacterium]|jgi:CPA2 family monovalent cation:H+ antiporter-2
MHIDPLLPALAAIAFVAFIVSFILKRFNQPYVIAYILAGMVLGPYGLSIINNDDAITKLGAIGVVILMFFIGMEVSPQRLAKNWKITVLGTLLQILLSVFVVWILGLFLDWPTSRIVLIGFVISISSTVIVLQLLRDWGELDTHIGQDMLAFCWCKILRLCR